LSGMLDVVRGAFARAKPPHAIIGSSMGGYLAALLAAEDPRIERLVLLAPAFRMAERWRGRMTAAELEGWRTSGLSVKHYGTRTERRIGYAFLEDLDAHPPFPEVRVPTLCIAGRKDDVVPLEDVQQFVMRTKTARLIVVDDGHELARSIDVIWDESRPFLADG
jgi:pimeloyl-ACP methyl ester carboxylesterase